MTVLAAAVAAGSVSSNLVVPGVLGFLVVAGMSVALFFLFRSMNTQLRKVAPPPATPDAAPAAKTGPASVGSSGGGQDGTATG